MKGTYPSAALPSHKMIATSLYIVHLECQLSRRRITSLETEIICTTREVEPSKSNDRVLQLQLAVHKHEGVGRYNF